MMGGDVTVTASVGKGSTFTVRLPAKQGCQPTAAAPVEEQDTVGPAGTDVLVIDDDPTARDLIGNRLR